MAGPIEHVVFLVKENHSFDNYFGRFPGADGDGTLPDAANPPTVDPSHTHKAWLNRAAGAVREQFGAADIPMYWAYARQYTLCDHYFTEIAGPSTPNHLMLIAADSPWIDNPPGNYRVQSTQVVDIPSLPAQLEQAGLTWGNYGGYAFEFIKALAGKQLPSTQFATDAAAGKLPTVSYVYADHVHSEHAPDGTADKQKGVGNVTAGSAWTAAQIDAIVAGGLWEKTAIFVTWDDWGGWADHVDPPEVETVDRRHAVPATETVCHASSSARTRRRATISHQQHSHVSLDPLLREDLRAAVAERAYGGGRRHGRLLRLHARAAAAGLDAAAAPTARTRRHLRLRRLTCSPRSRPRAALAKDRIEAAAAATTRQLGQAAASLRGDGRRPHRDRRRLAAPTSSARAPPRGRSARRRRG